MPAVKHNSRRIRRMLSIDEVAAHFNVAVPTIRALVARREFPQPVRSGRRMLRWDADVLDQWISGGCPKVDE